jgi:hypothetical protein
MKSCETCGTSYDTSFAISIAGTTYTFDSFAGAMQMLVPSWFRDADWSHGGGVAPADPAQAPDHGAR